MALLSVIVPCYNECEALPIFYQKLKETLSGMECGHEIIFVDDGSTDGTAELLRRFAEDDGTVVWLSLSRNFGKEAAMYAGLSNIRGDYAAIMDCDLQDPPEMLPEMLAAVESGEYSMAAARRVDRRGEPPIRSFFARRFYKFVNRICESEIADGARDFRVMTREVADIVVSMHEHNRFSKGIFSWVGFKTKWVPYVNRERVAGKTKWSFWHLFGYAIDGIINFSHVPLTIASWFGLFMTFFAFVTELVVIVRRLLFDEPVAGWASLVCIIVFIGGLQLFFLGTIGNYIAKLYRESKGRPHYIVEKSNRDDVKKVG